VKTLSWRISAVLLGTLTLGSLINCDEGTSTESESDDPTPVDSLPVDWEEDGDTDECNLDALLRPYSYGAKVKTLLTGLPLDDVELQALTADPTLLKAMIEGWLSLPEAGRVLERFFMTAFQQTGGDNASLFNLLGRNNTAVGVYSNPASPRADVMLNANFSESFARTVALMVEEGRPFSDVLSTDEFMMTTAQMAFLAFTDDEVVDDERVHSVRTSNGSFDTITLLRDQASAPPLAQALDPASAQFGKFWHGALAAMPTNCNVVASQTMDTTQTVTGEWRLAGGITPSFFVFSSVVLGRHQSVQVQGVTGCNSGASNKAPLIDREDFADWRLVKVRRPEGSETPTLFFDIEAMRDASELVLHTERLGFLTTPGFFSTWPTNEDNSARVTINQALIVALGESFEGVTVTDFTADSIDADHAEEGSECYGCHQTLDPMRDFYRATYTNFYSQQLDPLRADLTADFVFGGVQADGNGVPRLAEVLATHPSFPYAWAHKLCFYANSAACVEGEELDRVVTAFQDADLDFRVLIAELFSSPLVTGSVCVAGVDAGTSASIARRSTLCSAMSNRLGVDDICGIWTPSQSGTALQNAVRGAVSSVPDDSFSRAVVEPVVIAETSMFTRANGEVACVQAAQNGFTEMYGGLTSDLATLDMVTSFMGLPASDPRHEQALVILREHVTEALAFGKTEEEALQSAFVLACMSPSVAGVGF